MPLAPSRPEGIEQGPVPASVSPLARVEEGTDRFQRGKLIHALLQHLPALPESERHAAAVRYLERPGNDVPFGAPGRIADEVMAILHHPALPGLFGPGSRAEVPLREMTTSRVTKEAFVKMMECGLAGVHTGLKRGPAGRQTSKNSAIMACFSRFFCCFRDELSDLDAAMTKDVVLFRAGAVGTFKTAD